MKKVLSIKYIKIIKLVTFSLFLGILSTLYLLFNTSSVKAQVASRAITIIPPRIELVLDPGAKAEGIMQVINGSDEPITLNTTTRDFIVVDTKGTPNFLSLNTLGKKHSAAAWIGVSPNSFTIEPRKKQILNYYVQIPSDARPGGHYGGVVYEPITTTRGEGSGASVQTQIGTLFYISINGEIKEYSAVSQFLANPFQEYGPVKIKTQIINSGDLHIKPKGKIEVTDSLGRIIEVQELNQFNIYPGARRDFDNLFGKDKPMIGRYTAKLIAFYGKNNNLPLMATIYFWVFPWKLTLLASLIVVALMLGVMYWRKRKIRINTDSKQINADSPSTQNV